MYSQSVLYLFGWVFCLAIYGLIAHLAFQAGIGEKTLLLIPVLSGLLIEKRKLTGSWKIVWRNLLFALLGSLISFIPAKQSHYDLESHIEFWPFCFIFMFLTISIFADDERGVISVGEGHTLLLNLALIYLISDWNWLIKPEALQIALMVLLVLFTLYVFFHAFSRHKLSKNHRFVLSLWSSIIMLVFAINHLVRILRKTINTPELDTANWVLFLNYFLLGIALIYIYRNLLMLTVYLPEKQKFYNAAHKKAMQAANKIHIKRYSPFQLPRAMAWAIVLGSGLLYIVNFQYAFLDSHTLIMGVLWIFPLAVQFIPRRFIR